MWLRLAAGAAFLFFLWTLFRLAVGLRWEKVSREAERRQAEAGGGRVVAELPLNEGVVFFLEDASHFRWGTAAVPRREVLGARLLLNGGVVGAAAREGFTLPAAPFVEEYEGRERWDVVLYRRDGSQAVPCGTLREGVSREAAGQVFEAVRRALQAT